MAALRRTLRVVLFYSTFVPAFLFSSAPSSGFPSHQLGKNDRKPPTSLGELEKELIEGKLDREVPELEGNGFMVMEKIVPAEEYDKEIVLPVEGRDHSLAGIHRSGGNRLNLHGDGVDPVWKSRLEGNQGKWKDGDNGKSNDDSMKTTWNQREEMEREERKWGDESMRVWGKRNDGEKRKWGDNSMRVWGKRAGSDKENLEEMHKVNKRSILDSEEGLSSRNDFLQEPSKRSRSLVLLSGKQNGGPKRKWETNTMKVWGKRGENLDGNRNSGEQRHRLEKDVIIDEQEDVDPRYDVLDDLSKRSRFQMPQYGMSKQLGGPKRNWETNTMKVWGKRQYWDADLAKTGKRNWDIENMRMWGKRRSDDEDERKRSWTSHNTIRVWGKRSYQPTEYGDWRNPEDYYES